MKNIWSVVVMYKSRPNFLKVLGKNAIVVDNSFHNLGYAAGANRGIRKALAIGAKWIIVFNQDIELSHSAFIEFCGKLKKTPPGIAGPFAGSLDKKRWTSILPAKGDVDYISGSMMAIHRDVVREVGTFYEPYFMYYEDAELSARAANAGFFLTHIPLEVKHAEGSNEYYLARNHLLFVERNAPVSVKIHEFLRIVKIFYEHRGRGNLAGEQGVRDYMMRRFGRRDI